MIRRHVLKLLCAAPVTLLGACAYYGPGYGPPPRPAVWAPPRRIVWDPNLAVYIVVGSPGVYYLEPHYYRWRDGRWLFSRNRHDWHFAPPRELPPGLARRHPPGRRY